MAYKSPLAGYYSSKGSGSSPLAGFYPKETEEEKKKKEAQKRLDELAKAENQQKQPKSPDLGIFNFAKPISEGGINPLADVGKFAEETLIKAPVKSAETLFNQTRASMAVQKNNQGKASVNEKWLKSQNAEIDRALKAGEINKQRADQYRKKAQSELERSKQSVKKAEEQTGTRYDPSAGATALLETAGNIGGAKQAIQFGVKGAVKTGEALINKFTKGEAIVNKASQQAAEDAAIRKAAGIPEEPQNAPQSLKMASQSKSDMVGQAVQNKAQPGKMPTSETAQTRYTSKTLPESEFVAPDTKKLLGSSYKKLSNADLANTSLKQLDVEGTDNFATKIRTRLDDEHITPQTVVDAQAAGQALERRGGEADLQRAADIYNKLAEHLSKTGQTIQAAAIMAKQTPEGLSYFAQQQFRKAGVDFSPELQRDLKSYIDEIKAAKSPEEEAIARDNVTHFIATNIPSSKTDKLINFWKAGLLTSPTTTAGAIAGNTAQLLQRKLITNPLATLSDIVMSAVTGERTHAAASLGSSLKGTGEGAKTLASKQYLKTGYNPLETGSVDKYNIPRVTNYGKGAVGKALGGYVNGVYKVMGAADVPFRSAAYKESLSSIANSEAINKGLKGAEKKAFIDDFIKNPSSEAKSRAQSEAETAVFGNDTALGTAAQKLTSVKGPVGTMAKIVIPFTKVPAAVATKVVTSTPLGIANEIVRQVLKVKSGGVFDQRAMAKAIGEGMTGVPIIGAGFALGNSGLITGGYPSSQAERDQWQAEGKKPNSIKIGDKWYSLNYIQPFASLLATGAKFAEAQKAGFDVQESIAQAAAGMGQSVTSQSFLSGLQNALDAVKNPAQFGGNFVSGLGSSVVPNFIRAGAVATDPLQRDTGGDFLSGTLSGIPGLRETLNPKLDANNNPLPNRTSPIDQYFNPLKPSQADNTPDTQFMDQAVLPAKSLKSVRTKEINQLLSRGKVQAAQRKIEEYNQEVTKVIAPYVNANKSSINQDQLDQIDKLYMGQVWIDSKGRPYISTRKQ